MNILEDHLDILQNNEAIVVAFCAENPTFKDADVLVVYEKLASLCERRKRQLPDLQVFLPPKQLDLNLNLRAICDLYTVGGHGEFGDIAKVTPGVMLLCYKKLIESLKRWTKKDGPKGYIQFVSQYV